MDGVVKSSTFYALFNWFASPVVRAHFCQKGCDCVATKSVLKNIDVKTRNSAVALVNALENAKGKHAQQVVKTRTFSDANKEEIRKMFGANK